MTRVQNNIIMICLSFFILISIFPEIVTNTAINTASCSRIKVSVLDDKNKDSLGRETFIWGTGSGSVEYGVSTGFLETAENKGFKFIPKDPWVKNFIHTGGIGDYIVLNLKETTNAWVGVLMRPDASKILVEYDGISKVFDLYNKEHLSAEFRIYPFEFDNSIALGWIIRLLIFYCLYFVIIFITICFLYKFFKTIRIGYFTLPSRFLPNFMIFFFLQLVFYIIWQHFDPGYLKFGDVAWYWESGIKGFVNEKFSIENYALRETVVVRSYLLPFIILFIRVITGYNELFSKILYLVFASGVLSFFICFTMPKLYELLTGKKAQNIQVDFFGAITLYFWWLIICYPMVDMYASVFYFNAVIFLLMGLRVLQKGVSVTLRGGGIFLLTGAFFAATVLMRSNYVLLVNLCLVFLFLVCITNVFAGKIGAFKRIREKNLFLKNFNFLHMGLILAGIFIICLPELIINYYRGVFSFFQYDTVGVYTSPLQSLSTQLIAEGLIYNTGWPYVFKNTIGLSMINYANVNHFSMVDCLIIYISHPIESLAMLFKKLFLSIDLKTNLVYTTIGEPFEHFRLVQNKILRSINYCIWAIALVCIFTKNMRSKMFNNANLLLVGVTFIFLVLPLLMFHVEWRYYISMHLVIYYVFGYIFIGVLVDKSDKPSIGEPNLFFNWIKIFAIATIMQTVSAMFIMTSP